MSKEDEAVNTLERAIKRGRKALAGSLLDSEYRKQLTDEIEALEIVLGELSQYKGWYKGLSRHHNEKCTCMEIY